MQDDPHPLRAYRHAHNLSMRQIADLAGVTEATISRLERWLTNPSMALVERIVHATGGAVDANDFMEVAAPVFRRKRPARKKGAA